MDPRGQGPGAGGDGGAGGGGGGRGRAQMLRSLSLRKPGQTDGDTESSVSVTQSIFAAGRGALLRGMSADSSITTTEPPPTVPAGRGALLRNLSGAPSQSSSSVTSAATSRQEVLAKLQQKRKETEAAGAESVVPKPIGRAGLVSTLKIFCFYNKMLLEFIGYFCCREYFGCKMV